jgi:site-specific recombinase XerD
MSRKGARVRIAEGIHRDNLGLSAIVKVGKVQREKRFPRDAKLRELQRWRDLMRAELLRTAPPPMTPFGRDIVRYLRLVGGSLARASLKARRSELKAWMAAFGRKTRASAIDVDDVRLAIADWRTGGKSPKTIHNRWRTLVHFWRVIYRQPAPFEGVDLPRRVKRRPTFVSADVIRAVEAQLRAHEAAGLLKPAKTRARFMVLAATGIRPSHLKRATPADVDLARGVMVLEGAKGGEPVALPLNADMRAAWLTFAAAAAWGPFDTRSFGRTLVRCGWPAGVRRYNLRHALGIDLSEGGHDLADIQQWMGHSDIKTTRAHYVPVLNSRLKRLSEAIDGRLGWQAPLEDVDARASVH